MTITIAERNLTTADGRPVSVALSTPTEAEGQWQCALRLVVGGVAEDISVPGGDAFDALQMAMATLWARTRELGCTRYEGIPNDSGFFRPVIVHPLVHDVERIHATIDREIEQIDEDPAKVAACKQLGRDVAEARAARKDGAT